MLSNLAHVFEGNENIKFFVVQTVFEGHHINTADKLAKLQSQYRLKIPMSHDDGRAKGTKRSVAMDLYRPAGTPWFVVINKKGRVVFDGFRFQRRNVGEIAESCGFDELSIAA